MGAAKRVKKNHQTKVEQQNMITKIQEATKGELIPYLRDKMQETSNLIVKTLQENGEDKVSNIQIMSLIAKGSLMETALASNIIYTPQEIREGFNLYLEMIYKINEIKLFPPTIEGFCNFIGISRATFNNWLVDPDKKDVADYINSYLTGVLATGSLTGDLKEITSIYIQKTMGKVEQVAPTVVEHKKATDIDSIQEQIKALKRDNIIEAEWSEE